MIVGTLMLALATLLIIIAMVASIVDLRRPSRQMETLGIRTGWAAAATLLFLLLIFAALFLLGDLSVAYVWRNIDLTYPAYQRLSGVWVGREGSLLLWVAAMATFWGLEEYRNHRKWRNEGATAVADDAHTAGPNKARIEHGPEVEERAVADAERIRRTARPFAYGALTMLAAVVLAQDPFAPTAAADLAASPLGRGVNPQLITLYNAIHPPVVLIGYGLAAIPTLFGMAHLITGRPGWIGPARRWAQLALVVLTIGIVLGSLWAYIALGWGGYWAWDPVEVGILVPWLATVAFLHAGMRHDSHGQFPVAAPALAMLCFPAALFSTMIVRAGGVWVSVHSFLGAGDAEDAWGRFTAAFSGSLEVQAYTVLLVGLVAALLPLVWIHVGRIERGETDGGRRPRPARGTTWYARAFDQIRLENLFLVGTLLLTLLFTVVVTVLFIGIDGFPSNEVREAVFTERTGPIALAAIAVMGIAVSIGRLDRRQALMLHGGALTLGLGIGFLAFREHLALAMATSLLVTVAAVAAARITDGMRLARRKQRHGARLAGIHLVHLGVAVVLLGHGFVSTFTSDEIVIELEPGETRTVGPYQVTLETVSGHDGDLDGRLELVIGQLIVSEAGRQLGTVPVGFEHFERTDHYKPIVGIERGALKDVYFAPRGVHDPGQGWLYANLPLFQQGSRPALDVDGVTVGVSTVPYINIVWAGSAIMIGGAAILATATWTWPTTPRQKAKTTNMDAHGRTHDDVGTSHNVHRQAPDGIMPPEAP